MGYVVPIDTRENPSPTYFSFQANRTFSRASVLFTFSRRPRVPSRLKYLYWFVPSGVNSRPMIETWVIKPGNHSRSYHAVVLATRVRLVSGLVRKNEASTLSCEKPLLD